MTTTASATRLVYNRHVIGGRFRLVRALGEGGMGVVWEAVEARTGNRHALKFIKEPDRTPVTERRLVREAQAASAIRHPNVVRIDEVATDDDGTPVIIMEMLEGESLGERLEREGVLSLGQTAAIVQRVCAALRAAHGASIVHRDLKPDNVFLVAEPNGAVDVRVVDFGIAKQFNLPADSLTVTGTIVGTPLYMSPEQAGGERGLDARSDVWSVAVILFECLTSTTPVQGDNYGQLLSRLIRNDVTRLAELRPDLPKDLLAVVEAAFVPRDQRSADLAQMESVLANYADRELAPLRVVVASEPMLSTGPRGDSFGETVSVTWRQGTTTTAAPRTKGRAAWIAMAIAGLLVVVGAGSYAVRARMRRPSPEAAVTVTSQPVEVPSASSAEPPVPEPPVASAAPPSLTPSSPAPSASVVSAKRPPTPPAHASAAPPTASAGAQKHGPPEKRLQGGVAGDVPF